MRDSRTDGRGWIDTVLIELHIRNFAVIDEISLEFSNGLIALTGETGAGKSILVDALSLLLGARASTDVIRAGADRALVEGVFDVGDDSALLARLDEAGYPAEDGLLILRREVATAGRSRAWVNGSPATVSVMGTLAERLADLHSQHEHQQLLRKGEQRRILDAYAGASDLATRVAALHAERSELLRTRDEREARARELAGRSDFLRFQRDEIRGAAPISGEEDELEAEARVLAHAEELGREAARLHHDLYDGEAAVSDRIASALDGLVRLVEFDKTLSGVREQLEEAFHAATEAGRELGDYAAGVEGDPERLETIRQRLDVLSRLKRKYGATLEDVLETGRRVDEELAELDDSEIGMADLERRIEGVEADLEAAATRLTKERARAARTLSRTVQEMLPGLGLRGATFQMLLQGQSEIGPGGRETVEFRASLNPGFDPLPLSRIASGGELSRVMLALKKALLDVDPVPTLVFDEVDAGVGGGVASFVADRLVDVAAGRQVFVITHLPQVASRARHHFRVEKRTDGGRAASEVELLGSVERVAEIARMLGGDPESDVSRAHAQELLASR